MDNQKNNSVINNSTINNNNSDTYIKAHDIIETQDVSETLKNESNITTLFYFNKKEKKRNYSYSDAKWLTGC